MPNGLSIFELQVASHDDGTNTCIGGPHKTFELMANNVGSSTVLFAQLKQQLSNFRDFGVTSLQALHIPATISSFEYFENPVQKLHPERQIAFKPSLSKPVRSVSGASTETRTRPGEEEEVLNDDETLSDADYKDPEGFEAEKKSPDTTPDDDPAEMTDTACSSSDEESLEDDGNHANNFHVQEGENEVFSSSDDESPEDDAEDAQIEINLMLTMKMSLTKMSLTSTMTRRT